jgi:pimeloyl-ACP methyl ester carboxylesterase
MTTLDTCIRQAEQRMFDEFDLNVQERVLELPSTRLRVRVLAAGSGHPLLLLHGVTQTAAVWAPLLTQLRGYQLLAVDLPGHGLSDPVDYAPGQAREHTLRLMDDLLGVLDLEAAKLVGHSLGAMYAVWYAAARPSIEHLPAGTLREVPGGHAPWLEDAAGCAQLIVRHLAATGPALALAR